MIVVDASVAAKWLFAEEHTTKALDLAANTLTRGEQIAAPTLLHIEVANILRQRMRRTGVTLSEAHALYDQFLAIPIMVEYPAKLAYHALTVADTYGLPAIYDAHYLALAEHLDCDLWTADARLLRTVSGKLERVKWIGDYSSSSS